MEPSNEQTSSRITVFFDGQCGLCLKEINYYKKIQPANLFRWVDLNDNPEILAAENISLVTALMHLHAKDEKGQLHVGLNAFIVIWRGLGGFWSVLASVVSFPGIKHAGAWLYHHFANWRFNRLSHCQLAAKQAQNHQD